MTPFNSCLARDISVLSQEQRWLIDILWGAGAVGIIGGEPKCCKSFLGLALLLAIASGQPCLGKYQVHQTGPVLLFAAEDALPAVRQRLEGLCLLQGLNLDTLPIHVLTEAKVRLDVAEDCRRLAKTVDQLKPVMVLLDPFVRMHQVDENVSAMVAPLLGVLRDLQRTYGCAVALVHHARKGAGNIRTGQALRGSSELHAWLDASLFLRRRGERLKMWIEHRSLPSSEQPLELRLQVKGEAVGLALEPAGPAPDESDGLRRASPEERILRSLSEQTQPMSTRQLQQQVRLRTQTLCGLLEQLTAQGRVGHSKQGYWLVEGGPTKAPASRAASAPETLPLQLPARALT